MNMWFRHNKRRLYTWKAQGDGYQKQIDFILVEEIYPNGVNQVCGLPGADIYSDHVLLKLELEIRLKKIKRARTAIKKWDLEKLEGLDKEEIRLKLEVKMGTNYDTFPGVEDKWHRLKSGIKRRAKKPWIMQEIIAKMEERRKYKQLNNDEGRKKNRKLNAELRKETDKTRIEWLEKECKEIEELVKKEQYDLAHKKIK
ncbi:hypothetical protein J437_LFUL011243 [Ladona fulva]|uniref:Endonuclease/exonuclease/phosphatase domain-containing protein n=1 Tax=Ladona fulva TaxID=123851 RepID=A0A8K0KD99_LADFU|nr:hypothetical protein J437_LFUL011243 [Ladona fulva]